MPEINTARELIDVLQRALGSDLLPDVPLVCIRTEDGDMWHVWDVAVIEDELNAHIELRAVEADV